MGSSFENARLQAKQNPRRERKEPSLLGLVAQQSGRDAWALRAVVRVHSGMGERWEGPGLGLLGSAPGYEAHSARTPVGETADSQGAPAERMEAC